MHHEQEKVGRKDASIVKVDRCIFLLFYGNRRRGIPAARECESAHVDFRKWIDFVFYARLFFIMTDIDR